MQDYQRKLSNNSTTMSGSATESQDCNNIPDPNKDTESKNPYSTTSMNITQDAEQDKTHCVRDTPDNPNASLTASSSEASFSVQRKTWSARLRDKLEKREKETNAAAAEQNNEVQDKRIRVEQPASSSTASAPKAAVRRPSGGQKKRHKSQQQHLIGGSTQDGPGLGSSMVGGAGFRPTQGKSTSYHLTPSLLEEVLNEKKMSLMRSPEVVEHLQMLQRNVSINRLLGTAPPVVKAENGKNNPQVKVEQSTDGPPASQVATIGEITLVSIKKEGDSADCEFINSAQSANRSALRDARRDTGAKNDTCVLTPGSAEAVDNPLDLSSHKHGAS